MQILLENGEEAILTFSMVLDGYYYVWAELKTNEGTFKDCSGAFESQEKANAFLNFARPKRFCQVISRRFMRIGCLLTY